jgi:hypothetical protein
MELVDDAERGPTPIDIGVEIDHLGHHEEPLHIDDLGPNECRESFVAGSWPATNDCVIIYLGLSNSGRCNPL